MMSFLIELLVLVLILGLVLSLAIFAIRQIPLAPPFQGVAVAIVCLIVIVVLISMLTGAVDFPMGRGLRLR